MSVYIEKQAAIDALGKPTEVYSWEDALMREQWERDKAAIEAVPPADVRPVVRGKWTADGNGYHWVYVCSACGWKDGYPFNERHNFCPNCGADMRGGDAEWESTSSTTPE